MVDVKVSFLVKGHYMNMKLLVSVISIFSIVIAQAKESQKYSNVYKVVVLGCGVSGLTAGLYAAREKLDPLIIEGSQPGGMLVNAGPIENWPGQLSTIGPELVGTIRQQAEDHGAEFLSEEAMEVDFKNKPFSIRTSGGKLIQTHSVIIATGTMPRTLDCPGEKEYWGKGVEICVLCAGPIFKDKTVVVIGGGDLALDKALFLTRYAQKVILVHRKETLTASPYMQEKLAHTQKIETISNSVIKEIKGDDTVSHVVVMNQKTKKETVIPTDGVFLSIGFNPCTSIFENQLELTEEGQLPLIILPAHP